jgi:energy-coupling factor transport system ATP-binding protein
MEDVAKLVDRLIVMYKGKNIITGTPREVFMQSETLEKIGLAVPQVTYFVKALKDKGFDIRQDILTVEEAREELIKVLRERKK